MAIPAGLLERSHGGRPAAVPEARELRPPLRVQRPPGGPGVAGQAVLRALLLHRQRLAVERHTDPALHGAITREQLVLQAVALQLHLLHQGAKA